MNSTFNALWQRLRSAPITFRFGCLALLIRMIPGASELMAYDSLAVASGEHWRWLTANLAHFSWFHLAGDLAMFGVLGGWLESRCPRQVPWLIAITALVQAVWLAWSSERPSEYRGLSGLTSALTSALTLHLFFRNQPVGLATVSLLLLTSGQLIRIVLKADQSWMLPSGIGVAHSVHAIGLATGVLVALGGPPARPWERWHPCRRVGR